MWSCVLHRITHRAVSLVFRRRPVCPSVVLSESFLTSASKFSIKNGNVHEGGDVESDSMDNMSSCDTEINVTGKYKAFRDEDAEVIFDVEEERRRSESVVETDEVDEFAGISLKRGVTGVFDISDLVDILKKQKARDLFVVSVPREYCYVSVMVVVTGRSTRHIRAITEFIRKVYKRRKGSRDPTLKIEGETSTNWQALDLGNIALHVFLKTTREMYDLESLWSLGAEYDNLCRKPEDPLIALLQSQFGLEGLEPASSSETKNFL
ncbi:mitochondrial assembly of ribosomal large subunit protein 1 [Hetaerina americana]|uniref:mitochondrial assembly of ribosomal large subunit protein 1 n=1 Tax=Hetaerina americana TaxID=62018 RepID=UPI003A7F5D8A